MKFKVGDKVKYNDADGSNYHFEGSAGTAKKGDVFVISVVDDRDDNESLDTIYSVKGSHSENRALWYDMEKNFDLVKRGNGKTPKAPKINFLLKYDLDVDPVEEFETIKQIKVRIRELIKEGKNPHNIKVYEVKNVKEVELNKKTVVTIKGI